MGHGTKGGLEMKHLKLIGLTVLTLSASLAWGAETNTCRDDMRGNGNLIVGEGRQRAQFNVSGGQKGETISGRLDFRDKSSGIRLRSRNLTAYEEVDAETRRLTFDLGSDGTNGTSTAIVTLRDLGKKGRNDFFEISSGDYLASGNLRGGQIRLQRRGCDVEPPAE